MKKFLVAAAFVVSLVPAISLAQGVAAVGEGGALGALVPSNTSVCATGLEQVLPEGGLVGARGWCGKPVGASALVRYAPVILRSTPGIGRNGLKALGRGHRVMVKHRLGEWCHVSVMITHGYQGGFVRCAALRETTPSFM